MVVFARVAPRLVRKIGGYAHAKQIKRLRGALKKLRARVGRVHRDINRKLEASGKALSEWKRQQVALVGRLLARKRTDKNKLYSLHAPEVNCIAKGKARKRYEFCSTVSVAVTLKECFVLGARSYRSGQRRGITTRTLKNELKRRSAVEPVIGHMKTDGLLGRCHLKGEMGDAVHAVLCAAGHNIRLLLRHLSFLLALIRGRNQWPVLNAYVTAIAR